jgi:arylsulfatase A-like enzyme
LGELLETVDQEGLKDNTVFIFTSDHGDMLGSHGEFRKQRPWDESILTPFLLRYPALLGEKEKHISVPINSPDIMPTLLDICGLPIPPTVEGTSFLPFINGEKAEEDRPALLQGIQPFAEFARAFGGREYRGIRTKRYTYVRDLKGPWLLYDNEKDPYQMNNLADSAEHKDIAENLNITLQRILKERKDEFLSGRDYLAKWGYEAGNDGAVPYTL